jgi:hypothetical protein
VVMTYSITCPIIVPFGRHRRAGTWALLGGTQGLTRSNLVRQATPSGQGSGWETGPSSLPPGPWLSLGPAYGNGESISGWTHLVCWVPGQSHPSWPYFLILITFCSTGSIWTCHLPPDILHTPTHTPTKHLTLTAL